MSKRKDSEKKEDRKEKKGKSESYSDQIPAAEEPGAARIKKFDELVKVKGNLEVGSHRNIYHCHFIGNRPDQQDRHLINKMEGNLTKILSERIFTRAIKTSQQAIIKQAESPRLGSTLNIAALYREAGQTILTNVNIGDSRACLVKKIAGDFTFTFLSKDHHPDVPEEKERLKRAGFGAKIKGDRVNGLALSREMGGAFFLPKSSAFDPQEPDFRHEIIDENCVFLLLFCDGIVEPFKKTPAQLIAMLKKVLIQYEKEPQEIPLESSKMAYFEGSGDNISLLIYVFDQAEIKEKKDIKKPAIEYIDVLGMFDGNGKTAFVASFLGQYFMDHIQDAYRAEALGEKPKIKLDEEEEEIPATPPLEEEQPTQDLEEIDQSAEAASTPSSQIISKSVSTLQSQNESEVHK